MRDKERPIPPSGGEGVKARRDITDDLSENGSLTYIWREEGGIRRPIAVRVHWKMVAHDGEAFEAFEARLLALAAALGDLDYPVIELTFHRRAHQHKLPWAEFDCATPESDL
jgi:hypothetical protein